MAQCAAAVGIDMHEPVQDAEERPAWYRALQANLAVAQVQARDADSAQRMAEQVVPGGRSCRRTELLAQAASAPTGLQAVGSAAAGGRADAALAHAAQQAAAAVLRHTIVAGRAAMV
jgi:hypothetical protein